MVTQMKRFSSSSTLCKTNFISVAHLHGQSFEFCLDFTYLSRVLVIYCTCMHLISSSHPFPTSVVEHLKWDPTCQQHSRCLIAAHSLPNFWSPLQELDLQHVLPSPNHHEFCKHQAMPSTQMHLVCRSLYCWDPLPPTDDWHVQEDQLCRHGRTVHCCRNPVNPINPHEVVFLRHIRIS